MEKQYSPLIRTQCQFQNTTINASGTIKKSLDDMDVREVVILLNCLDVDDTPEVLLYSFN